jgi:tetratricopeptide (TPR) repeat protein
MSYSVSKRWNQYLNNEELIKGIGQEVGRANRSAARFHLNPADYNLALKAGLGAIGTTIERTMGDLSCTLEFGLDQVSSGIQQLRADLNVGFTETFWHLERQTERLASIEQILVRPLDTQAKELRDRALYAYENEWYEESLEDLFASERLNYQDFVVHRSIGSILLHHLVDVRAAHTYFERAAKYAKPSNPQFPSDAYYMAGIAAGVMQEYILARTHMDNALSLSTENCAAAYMAAALTSLLGDSTTCTQYLRRAIDGDSRFHERASFDRIFDSVRDEVTHELDKLLHDAKEHTQQEVLRTRIALSTVQRMPISIDLSPAESVLTSYDAYCTEAIFFHTIVLCRS